MRREYKRLAPGFGSPLPLALFWAREVNQHRHIAVNRRARGQAQRRLLWARWTYVKDLIPLILRLSTASTGSPARILRHATCTETRRRRTRKSKTRSARSYSPVQAPELSISTLSATECW